MMLVRVSVIVGLGLAVTVGCGKDEGKSESSATQTEARSSERERPRSDKDRGEASMMLGDHEWKATRARALITDRGTLKISASQMSRVGDSMVRQSLELYIDDFDGPGDYKTSMRSPSMFMAVGVDTSAVAKNETEQAALDALSKAKMVHIRAADVTITSVTDDEVIGTFAFENTPSGTPEITDGSFRARIKK